MKEYEFYWDSFEWGGLAMEIVKADSIEEARAALSERYPEDVGADGFYNDPVTGEEKWIGW